MCLVAFGQGTTSRFTGTVSDSTGAAVAGAAVTLISEATNANRKTKTADNGVYAFEALVSGNYTVEVEAPGFRRFASRNNRVAVGSPTTVNVSLEVGGVTERIEVQGSAEVVQTSTSGNFGTLIQENVLKDLPIVGSRGRNPLDLILLQPGVVSGSNTGGGTHVNGARDRAWNYTLDGIDSNETSAGGSQLSPIRLNPDALSEMRIITSNATAENGRNSGGAVSMVSKSGSNDYHGKGFYFYRTPRLNANEWENNVNLREKRQFVQNIVGGDLGGFLIKNKTFFYSNVQVLRARNSGLFNRTVMTQQARQGILRYAVGARNQPAGTAAASVDTAGNVAPGVNIGTYNVGTSDPQRIGLDKQIQTLIAATPLPNNYFGGDGLNTAFYTFSALQNERQYDSMVRIDHIINSKNTLFGRVSWGQQDSDCDQGNGGAPLFPGRQCTVNTKRNPRNMAFNWRWNPTPTITNELVVGRNSFAFDFQSPFADLNTYALSTPIDLVESTETGNLRKLRTWQVVDNLSWQRGAHTVKFGLNFRWQSHVDTRGSVGGLNVSPLLNFSTAINNVDPGTFNFPTTGLNTAFDQGSFQSWTNLLLGRVGQRQQSFVADGSTYKAQPYQFESLYNEYDFYIQDTWKLSRNFTVDAGLRLEMKLAPDSPSGTLIPNQAVVAGAPASNTIRWVPGQLFNNSLNNWGPSLGFAWDPFGNGKTSIRSNYRIAYDRLPTFLASGSIFQSYPGRVFALVDTDYGRTGGRLASVPKLAPPTTSPESLTQPGPANQTTNAAFDPNMKMPTTHQWAFSIQREILPKTVLEVSYIGRRAYHLLASYNANQPEVLRNGFVNEFLAVKNGGESATINRLATADSRLRAGETGSQLYRRLFPADFTNNAVATVANRIATQTQNGRSVTDLSGAGPFALIPFPQFGAAFNVFDSNAFSTYHALQMQLERRFSNGVSGQISYVWAKSLDTQSFDPSLTAVSSGASQTAGNAPFDIYNRRDNYARSDFDRRHVVQSNFVYELPFGRGKRFGDALNGVVDRVVGGWQVAGIWRFQTGRPMTLFSGFNTYNIGNSSTVNCNGCTSRNLGTLHDEAGILWWFTPEERAQFTSPAAGEKGNTGRNAFSGPQLFNIDMTMLKRVRITERIGMEFRADATNLTNTPGFGFPTTALSSAVFGRIRDSVNTSSRKIQLGAKFTF
ncbi:MAG: carboxypeptidase regulatory-like domain-containing protein [Bryobacteraceae bacterium]|nr:carboxypeptidase regulatory-like domain-containing protein [Bryobacteraceae bacterium]